MYYFCIPQYIAEMKIKMELKIMAVPLMEGMYTHIDTPIEIEI